MERAIIALFHESGQALELIEHDLPKIKSGEILVRNAFTCLCSSDLHTYQGKRIEKCPTILGHEISGRVEALPENEVMFDLRGKAIQTGDLITWAIYSSDPHGILAQRGIPQKSDQLFKYGHEKWSAENSLHGGLATHTLLRVNTPIVVVSEPIPDKVLAIVNCSVATAAGAIRLSGSVKGKRVLISGVGMLGIAACAMCVEEGAEVFAVDMDEVRLKVSQQFGAKPLLDKQFMDVVLEFSGSNVAMQKSLDLLQIGGTAIWVGATFPQDPLQLDTERLIRHLHIIKGLHNYSDLDLIYAVEFMEKHHLTYPFKSLIHEGYGINEVNQAFEYAVQKRAFRTGIYFH